MVTLQNGKAFANSRDVAEYFGKRHDNILRALTMLECSREFYDLNFEAVTFEFQNGRGGTQTGRAFNMTKDGSTLLAMGFTGKQAFQFKIAYITRFNEMEAALRTQAEQGGPRSTFSCCTQSKMNSASLIRT